MTGVCPLCKELIVTPTVLAADVLDRSTLTASIEMLEAVRSHWTAQHTPRVNGSPSGQPLWWEAHAASVFGAALGFANAVEISPADRAGYVFSLFWFRQQLYSVGFDPLEGRMAQRPATYEALDDAPVNMLVLQGRIEALEQVLKCKADAPAVFSLLTKELDRWRALTNGLPAPASHIHHSM